ncbi:tectonin beta-propeller repeat-containing protein 2 [Pelobates fuscus]|uniref:tectonin beta-propeller repeat-containing protein 2 n=1 Tax=Pelobates fuscus TaxID=191477 RepID=UPI002FE49079
MACGTESVVFKEFCPLYSIINAIPAKVQKGFRSIIVYLTALHANGDYIAIGSSIGMLYLYCRHTNQMKKYNLEGKMESISVVKLLSCFDDLVAVGTVSGRVAIFQLVSPLPGRNKQLRRFDVLGIHKSSITALAWSPNGMKLFSGDDRGKIIQSDLDLDKGSCNSSLILEELSSVVQLDYNQKVLLVSTTQRCLLFYTEEKSVKQVGNQPRKLNGRYGACFIPGLCRQSDLRLFSSRPGLRIWKADANGSVQSTFLLKDALSRELKSFELYPRADTSHESKYVLPAKHLSVLSCFLNEGWVLSWDEYSIYLIDTLNQAVVGGLETSGDIVSVSSTNNEIFLLKGDRDIIRISDMPEGAVSAGLSSPFRVRTVFSPEVGRTQLGTLSDVQENPKMDGHTVKTERIQIETENDEGDLDVTGVQKAQSCSLPAEVKSRSSSMNSLDSGFGLNAATDHMSPNNVPRGYRSSSQRFSAISSEEFEQELVVQSIKVKKKKKKRHENGPRNHDTGSLESTPSVDSPLTLNSDFFSATPSLPSGSVDQLSSQESLNSVKCHSVLDDSSADVFCALQPVESPAEAPDNDVGPLDEGGNVSLDVTEKTIVPENDSASMSLDPLQTDNSLKPTFLVDKESLNSQPDAEGGSALNLFPSETFENSTKLIDAQDSLDMASLALTIPEETNSLEVNEKLSEMPKEDQELFTINTTCHVFSSFIGSGTCQNVYAKQAFRSDNTENTKHAHMSESSDEEDIYSHRFRRSSPEENVAEMEASQEMTRSTQEGALVKSEQLAESWMVYSGPASGILSLVVSEKYIWCLDYKGSLYCSALPGAGLRWQKFEESVQQVAVSPTGNLLWKVEQKTDKAFACGKVTIKGKRHWYEALPQVSFVALSDDTAWIIRTNGDLYLQTGLSVDRPCARAEKVDCPCPLSQISARNNVVWALTEQRGLLYREGVSSFSPAGDEWKCDLISERQALEPVCLAIGDQETVWTLDASGNLWFRTGVTSKRPEGEDDHWWQVSITDYVVFDHYTLFQTLIQATHTVATVAQAPVEKVADKLRMTFCSQQTQCQPSLLGVNRSGVWITSGKNEFHVAKGSLVGTYWHNIVLRGTASTTRWASVSTSASPSAEGSVLWICQSRKDLFCLTDLNPPFRPSTVQLPPDTEMIHISACPDAVWALDIHGGVFIRILSKTCPTGMHWTRLDLSQLGPVKLCSFSCGNQHIWACDTSGVIYFRVGTQPLNPSMMLPAWIMIEPPIQPVGINLVRVFSSPNDCMLWTIDNKYNVYVRIGITEEMPVGIDWEHVPGLQACQLAVSTRTVWARCPNGDIARRYGITEKNSAGDYWKKIPGNAAWLSVTTLDELWAVDTNGYLLQRLTKTYSHHPNIPLNDTYLLHSDFEDEWEVI